MSLGPEYARLESLMAAALREEDPVAGFRAAAEDGELTEELRRAVQSAAPEGIRIASLLVARLRFERLMNGSVEADGWFERDPKGFTAAFRRYHREVAPREVWARGEGESFATWADEHGLGAALAPQP